MSSTTTIINHTAPTGQQTPITTYHRAIDEAIHKLLGFKVALWRAQEAGLLTVDLADPDSDQVRTVAVSIAIQAVEFVASVHRNGGAA